MKIYNSANDVISIKNLDCVVSAGNGHLFTADQLAAPNNGVINFHAAPLPDYRGSAAPAFAILEGCENFGITFHKMIEELDALTLQRAVDLHPYGFDLAFGQKPGRAL
ncbi:MAG: hypothetical protein HN877_15055 [Rhodospirillaceae bacterium]|nr:hypothetical protein [Rhodospirillaceae bacterium]